MFYLLVSLSLSLVPPYCVSHLMFSLYLWTIAYAPRLLIPSRRPSLNLLLVFAMCLSSFRVSLLS